MFYLLTRKFIIIFALINIVFTTGCSDGASNSEIKFSNWGPQTAEVGAVPNKQPDGGMGIWIEVSGKKYLGDFQVTFNGHPLSVVGGGDQLITASVPASLIASVGAKEVAINQIKNGKIFLVGTFNVNPTKPVEQKLEK